MTQTQINRDRIHFLLEREKQTFRERFPKSKALAQEAQAHLLSGVPMAWMTRWPGDWPVFFTEAKGAHFTDADGHQFVDFCLGDTGAMTGHGLDTVADALSAQARRGITTMLPSADAAWVAAELHSRFGMARWQFAMTATDANRFVLRLSRQITGKRKVLVFDYSYHGTVEESLVTVDAQGNTIPRAGNLGWAVHPSEISRVAQFNDLGSVEAQLRRGDVSAVLTEPALTNIGIVPPQAGFLEGLRDLCTRYGAHLVIDETHTICVGPGGATKAWSLKPDFFVIGKPIGGGMPAAAYAMTQEVADSLDAFLNSEDVDVSGIGGTLTGNALAMAAMKATLSSTLRDEDYARMIPLAAAWTKGVQDVIDGYGLPWSVQQLGSRAEYWFCPPPKNGAQAAAAIDGPLDAYMHLYALNRDILLTPFHNMALLSPHHTQADVDRHSAVLQDAVRELVG